VKLDSRSFQAWKQPEPGKAKINLDLTLGIQQALPSPDVAWEIARRGEAIRQELFRIVAEEVVPSIAGSMGMATALPADWRVRGSYATEGYRAMPAVKDGVLRTHNDLLMTVNLTGDGPLNPAQLLLADRAGFAAHVADHVLFTLKQDYLGATAENTAHAATLRNGRVTGYEATSATE
jgi:hypothetical protein